MSVLENPGFALVVAASSCQAVAYVAQQLTGFHSAVIDVGLSALDVLGFGQIALAAVINIIDTIRGARRKWTKQ